MRNPAQKEVCLNYLRKLFSYTQTSLAKRLAARVFIPIALALATREAGNLISATFEVVRDLGVVGSLPYILACAMVVVLTFGGRQVARELRKTHKLF